ncbi:arsenite methyltransferase [Chloroflexota bacterium]
MASSEDRDIKNVVRERYAAHATGVASCCSPSCCLPSDQAVATGISKGIYIGTDLEGLTPEAIAASAGCGNPTALADLKPGEVVMDLGSGGGIDCFLASRAVGPQGRVIGIDMTPEMIELARSNAMKLGVTNVEFHLGEMENLPFESNTVDAVISNCVICLSPDKDAVLREALRVLKPGGRIHVSDMMLVGELPQAIKDDPQRWAECVSGADQRETYLGRLAAAGFQGIAVEAEESYKKEPGLENLRSVRVRAVKPE